MGALNGRSAKVQHVCYSEPGNRFSCGGLSKACPPARRWWLLGKVSHFLEFCVREIGPSIYSQAIADAQAYIQEKAADLGGNRYEAEFDYWRK